MVNVFYCSFYCYFMEVIDYILVDGCNKIIWYVGIVFEKFLIYLFSKWFVIKFFLCVVYGINNEFYLL